MQKNVRYTPRFFLVLAVAFFFCGLLLGAASIANLVGRNFLFALVYAALALIQMKVARDALRTRRRLIDQETAPPLRRRPSG